MGRLRLGRRIGHGRLHGLRRLCPRMPHRRAAAWNTTPTTEYALTVFATGLHWL